MPFKVNDVSTNQNPSLHFILVLTYILSRTIFQLSCIIGQTIIFDKGVPLVNSLILGNLCKYIYLYLRGGQHAVQR